MGGRIVGRDGTRVGRGGKRVGKGGKIVGSGPIVGIGTTGVLLGGLVGCPGVLVRGGSGVLVGAGGWVGVDVLVGSAMAPRSSLWQSGSDLSARLSSSSSMALKQYSFP